MNTVNWWLMALAFVLGLLLTFVTMIRRVKREVPIQIAAAGAAGGPTTAVRAGFTRWDKVGANEEAAETPAAEDDSTTKLAPADAVGTADATSQDKPYGVGSVRVAAGTSAPQGYTVKGNENSMLYHTPDSPSYAQTIAEVWFKDEESAVLAGFTPWHKGRKTS